MAKVKEGMSMQTYTSAAVLKPLAKKEKEKTRLVQAEIPQDLWEAVEKGLKNRNLNIKEALVFGLQCFVLQHEPKEAAKLGIESEE